MFRTSDFEYISYRYLEARKSAGLAVTWAGGFEDLDLTYSSWQNAKLRERKLAFEQRLRTLNVASTCGEDFSWSRTDIKETGFKLFIC